MAPENRHLDVNACLHFDQIASATPPFSVSPSHVDEEHHRRETFQEEFRRLCPKYGVELDEKYAWD